MTLASLQWDRILGGFGLFMFGITFMGDGLKAAAGDKLRDYINKYTSNPLKAALIGIIITIVMQSSSASTAITIGLVRAGLMNLEQAAGIVFGANIGTTITSFLISLNIDRYTMYIIFIGAMIICFGKRRKTKYLGNCILGFGMIFYGLSSMGDALSGLKDLPEFTSFALSMSNNPWLSMFAGALLTGIIQASSATIGVVQKMYQAGALSFMAVLPFVFGANIGTTVTGILAAIGGSTAAKRTAGIHTMFNIIGTALGMLLLKPYANIIMWLTDRLGMNPMMQVAVSHILFNGVTALILFPFIKQMCTVIRKVIPGKELERVEVNVQNLDTELAATLPSAAIASAGDSIRQMAGVVSDSLKGTREFLNKPGSDEDADILHQNEGLINQFDKKITEYLVHISTNVTLSEIDTEDLRLNLEVIKNLERIGDLCENLVEFFQMIFEDREKLSGYAMEDVNAMFQGTMEMLDLAMKIYTEQDESLYPSLLEKENSLDQMEFAARQAHFNRMSGMECTSAVAASVYCDILGNLERIGDHACNIGKSVVTKSPDDLSPDELVAAH